MVRDNKGRFAKGQSGNPKGRVKGVSTYTEAMQAAVTVDDMVAIATKAREQALRGDAAARKWLSDYLLGLPRQGIDLNHSGQVAIPGLSELIAKVYGRDPSGAGGSSST